ncbi:MAG: hypothetical protein DRP78_02790 [Candidatus Omnitrophota bacterium]|nr:MAG: hypothetical protein DRP78_02790 [Candidatus Omnitrophota bacterium]
MPDTVIKLKNVSKIYSIEFSQRSIVMNIRACFKPKMDLNTISALDNVSFSVKKGEAVGIIGENGSGKTTLLRVISGIINPEQGEVYRLGKISGIFELNAGFHPELTGKENIHLNAFLLGMHKQEIADKYHEIVEFSGLGKFINAQVKTYSQGMLVRLGFSVAVSVNPDIFLIDDTLSVGDEQFQRRCVDKIRQFKEMGKTIVIVSHNLDSLSGICKRGLLLKNGILLKDSLMQSVILRYVEAVGEQESIACIDHDSLSLIFNQGKISLFWNGLPITNDFGGYISILVSEKWLLSKDAQWQVKETKRNSFKAEGYFSMHNIKVCLEVMVKNAYKLSWQVNVITQSAIPIKKIVIGLMLGDAYNYFFNGYRLEQLVVVDTASKWQDVYRTDEYNLPLLLSSGNDFPAMALHFDHSQEPNFRLIQVTDKATQSRTMQIQILPKTSAAAFSCKVDLHILSQKKLKLFLDEQLQQKILQAGQIKILLNNKKIYIYYNEQQLTQNEHLNFFVCIQGILFNLFDGDWNLEEKSEKRLVLSSFFKHLWIKLLLKLELNSDSLAWELSLENIKNEQKVDFLLVQGMFIEQYTTYFTLNELIDFSESVEFVEQLYLSKRDKYVGLSEKSASLPTIVFENTAKANLTLRNGSFDQPARIVLSKSVDFKSICGRLIFFPTEQLVSDFTIQKQKEHYEAFVLSNDKLCFDFRKANPKIFFEGRNLTAGQGISTNIFFNGRWSKSNALSKHIYKKDNCLIVHFKRQIFDVEETWKFELNEQSIIWSFNFSSIDQKYNDLDYQLEVFLDCKFVKWFNGFNSGLFFERDNDAYTVNSNSKNNEFFALTAAQSETPAFVMTVDPNLAVTGAIVQDYSYWRILQLKLKLNKKCNMFQVKIDFVPKNIWDKKIIDLRNKLALYKWLIKHTDISLIYHNHCLKLQYNDQELTTELCMHSAFLINGLWHTSAQGIWQVNRGENVLSITLDWETIPLRQIWQISAQDDGFIWTIYFELKEALAINRIQTGIMLSKDYEQWFVNHEQGYFPDFTNLWQKITMNDVKGKIFGVQNIADLPGIICENLGSGKILIENSPDKYRCRAVKIEDDFNTDVELGKRYKYFCAKISLLKTKDKFAYVRNQKIEEFLSTREIKKGRLKVYAQDSSVQIYWDGLQISSGQGLHTALQINGQWVDSGICRRIIEKIDEYCIYIELIWTNIPLKQTWKLHISNFKIRWQVSMHLNKKLEIESFKTGIIVSNDYKKWFNGLEEGIFPENSDLWCDIVRNRQGKIIGTYAEKKLPAIMFSIGSDNYLPLIANTDFNIKGRVFQAESNAIKGENVLFPKANPHFFCTINFSNDNRIIKNYKECSLPLEQETEIIYIYGATEHLHNRVAGINEFGHKIKKINKLIKNNKDFKIKIGISRFNFFKLSEIIQFLISELSLQPIVEQLELQFFPLKGLLSNFLQYWETLKTSLKMLNCNIELALTDSQLFQIITAIYTQANDENEAQLLRLLGLICEHAFVGPQVVVIDPYHKCNANCIHCWVHNPKIKHQQEFLDVKLDFEKCKNIVDDLATLRVDIVIFQGDGEPLLHNRFIDMLKYTHAKGVKSAFFTNGILLNKNAVDTVVELGVDQIFCSLPAGTPEIFAKINTKQSHEVFLKILTNLEYLSKIKKKRGTDRPRLIMTHVIHHLNAGQLMQMAENDVRVGADNVSFNLVRLDKQIEFLKLTDADINGIKLVLPKIKTYLQNKNIKFLDILEFQLEHFSVKTGNFSKQIFLDKGCPIGWQVAFIPGSGEVSFCCHLRTTGYLNKQSFKEIWNSDVYAKFRYQAKFMSRFKDIKFLNGQRLYDEYCEHCDTHQVIRDIWEELEFYKLNKFISDV